MRDLRPQRLRNVSITTVIALVLTTAISTAVIATHSFNDVPDDNTFHNDIAWLKDHRVTRGCNPPANDQFCPKDNVTREQMSAFMRRLAQTFGADGDGITDTSDPITLDDTTFAELARVQVAPKAGAKVVLNAHTSIGVDVMVGGGAFEVIIARDSCDGTAVASGAWETGESPQTTVAVAGFDQIEEATTYVLCAAKDDDLSEDGTAFQRGLNASWTPLG